jgi:PIN domain nuclease of toxin-antitoxin system
MVRLAGFKLSTAAHAMMADPNNKLYFSPASFWEMAIKVSLKKLNLAILPIEMRHAAALATLPYHHKDPVTVQSAARSEGAERLFRWATNAACK